MVDFEIKGMSALCAISVFKINEGLFVFDADYEDFGDKKDLSPETAEDYCCGDMQFTSKDPTKETLKKYGITKEEYEEICDKLGDVLSFGACGWCS